MYSIQSGQLWQVTKGAGASRNPMLNRIGNHLTLESQADLKGDGHDTGISQIFWYDKGTETLFQMTDGNASSRNPYLDERRPAQVYFESDATDLPGTSGGPGTQIYRATISSGELPFIEQMTFGPGDCTNPAIDPSGTRIVFLGTGDILQNGTFGRRLFALDIHDPVAVLYQLTGRGTVFPPVGASLGHGSPRSRPTRTSPVTASAAGSSSWSTTTPTTSSPPSPISSSLPYISITTFLALLSPFFPHHLLPYYSSPIYQLS
jgi:Tol biopolymer transport system component